MKLNKKLKYGSAEHMLETLKLAYQFVLGQHIEYDPYDTQITNSRLSEKEQRELGKRLAFYWTYKCPINEFLEIQKKKIKNKEYEDGAGAYY